MAGAGDDQTPHIADEVLHAPDSIEVVEVGGESALLLRRDGRVVSVDTVEIKDGLIAAYRRVLNPEKLAHV
ncbi:hypothetical protein [Streptomyces sp. Tue6028]|uniref:hypothetical protein n=1 Tax=Streptomyces sp. Tue6028 TaxID=2036037 RepID=UPI003EB8F03D